MWSVVNQIINSNNNNNITTTNTTSKLVSNNNNSNTTNSAVAAAAAAATLLTGILPPKLLQQYSSAVMNAQNDPIVLNKLMQSYLEQPQNTPDYNAQNQQDLFNNAKKQDSNLNRLNVIETDELDEQQEESAVNISFNHNDAMLMSSKQADDSVLVDLNTELNDTLIANVNNLTSLNETTQEDFNQLNNNLNEENLNASVADDQLAYGTAAAAQKLRNEQDEANDDDQQIDNIVINFQENEEEDDDTDIKLDTH